MAAGSDGRTAGATTGRASAASYYYYSEPPSYSRYSNQGGRWSSASVLGRWLPWRAQRRRLSRGASAGRRARRSPSPRAGASRARPGEARVASPTPLAVDPAPSHAILARSAVALDAAAEALRRRPTGAATPRWRTSRSPTFPLAKDIYAAAALCRAPSSGGVLTSSSGPAAASPRSSTTATSRPGSARSGPRKRSAPRAAIRIAARAPLPARAVASAWRRHAGRHAASHAWPSSATQRIARSSGWRISSAECAGDLGWEWEVVDPSDARSSRTTASPPTASRSTSCSVTIPTEYLHELPGGARPSRRGRPLAQSTRAPSWPRPRAPSPRCGRSFATAGGSPAPETALVERLVPPTGLASQVGWLDRARARPEDWVLKPVLGRYSERVAAGRSRLAEEWQAALDAAAASPDDWIVQAFVPPRRRWLPSPAGGRPGYVNWGVYLAGGKPAGICPRFQPTPLTDDATVWWAPLVIRRRAARATDGARARRPREA